MDKDIESKIERLGLRYAQTQADLDMSRPHQFPSNRTKRRIQQAVANSFTELRNGRGGPGGSLVKLAYVRGMRSVVPQARMSRDELKQVETLQRKLDRHLTEIEAGALRSFRGHLRSLVLSRILEEHDYPAETVEAISKRNGHFPLEQRARAAIRGITQEALDLGARKGAASRSYDGEENADR